MLSGPMCVECSAKVGKLYTEYSEGNVKLTRCESCGAVADPYIEYELVLVVIDLVLHRIQAYRHLLFNREPACSAQPAYVKQLFFSVVFVSIVLRISLLNWLHIPNPHGKDLSLEILQVVLKAFCICLVDHVLFVAFAFSALMYWRGTGATLLRDGIRMRRLYCALPEVGKVVAFLIDTWDKEPTLMALVGLIVVSAQHMALSAVASDNSPRCLLAVLAALAARVCFRLIVHSSEELFDTQFSFTCSSNLRFVDDHNHAGSLYGRPD